MIDDVLKEISEAADKSQDVLKRDLAKLRTGRAHPAMLDSVKVDYYGQKTPISQVASVGVPEPRMLTVKPWEKSQVAAIDKALRECNLGLNPQTDGDLLRIPIPPLSEERRKELVKLARKNGEDCKVGIRHARHAGMARLTKMKQDGDASEDDVERSKKKVEDLVAAAVQSVDQIIQSKEKEILVV